MWMWFRVCLVFVSDVWALLKLLCIFSPDASRLWLAKRSALQGEADMMRCSSWKSFLVTGGRGKKTKQPFSQGQGKTPGLQYTGVQDYWVPLRNKLNSVSERKKALMIWITIYLSTLNLACWNRAKRAHKLCGWSYRAWLCSLAFESA